MIGWRFCSTPIRVLIPGRQLPEDALNQIDERELISRDDYDKLAVLGWNAFWDEHYEKMTSGRKISYVTVTQNQLLDLYKEEVTIYHGQDIHPHFWGVCRLFNDGFLHGPDPDSIYDGSL